MTWDKYQKKLYCCVPESEHDVVVLSLGETAWDMERTIASNDTPLLQLQITYDEIHLIGTFMLGFKASVLYFYLTHCCPVMN